jgi:hypothetical protein
LPGAAELLKGTQALYLAAASSLANASKDKKGQILSNFIKTEGEEGRYLSQQFDHGRDGSIMRNE